MAATTAATTLADEIAAVMDDVVGYDGAAITDLTSALGRRALTANRSPPCVVWYLGGGGGGPAVKKAFPGGRRSLRTRLPTLRALCWAETLDATLALSNAVLAAMERRYGGRLPYLGETWAEDPALIDLGEQCELAWTLQLAVLDRAPTLATVTETAFNTSTASSTDGVLHIGETS